MYMHVCKTYVYIYFISGAPQSSWPCQKSQSNSSIQILENLPHKFKVVFFSRLNLSRTMGVVNDFIVTALVFLKINSFFILFHDHSPIPSWICHRGKGTASNTQTTSFVIIQHVTACFRGWILPIFPWECRGTPPMGGGGWHWVPLDSHDFFCLKKNLRCGKVSWKNATSVTYWLKDVTVQLVESYLDILATRWGMNKQLLVVSVCCLPWISWTLQRVLDLQAVRCNMNHRLWKCWMGGDMLFPRRV